MKKLFSIMLCIAVTACILSGCRRAKDPEATSESTTNTTTETTTITTEMTMPTTESIAPTTHTPPSVPASEHTEAPSTISPSGGVDNDDTSSGSQRAIRGRR